ncbi:SgcJ/EcaC family oxidoreductase [Synechococcus sp. CBW1107]|uniref:SgcJ/EcaC family oxidoreductase n=1 Tax=Synechococcus sp. CBW1107 TaxID=2789857 RepID=UPI002AD28E9F|nr:SgcJ/EcaC family oxidoreductase [Synechococcus sp. CBW1107]CAK6694931.1 hypothetical protein ICNINCKA_01722 [Synechococcus sp. CBW1107]
MSSEIAEVTRVVNAFSETWNRHDINAFADLFAEDAEFVNVVGLWWKGRPEIKGAHEFTHQTMFKHSRLSIQDVVARFPTPNIAIARCRWTLEGHVSPEGLALPPRNGILVNMLQQDGGTWRIIDSQNTDIIEGVVSRPQ